MNYQDIRLEEGFVIEKRTAGLTDHEMHSHDALEISIVWSNRIRYKLLKQDYFGSPGDVFMYRPFDPHWTLTEHAERPAEWIMVLFSPSVIASLPFGDQLLTPFYAMHSPPLIPAQSDAAPAISRAALTALDEERDQRPGWKHRRFLCLMEIITQIYRHYMELQPDLESLSVDIADIIRTIRYITMNIGKKLAVDDLIQRSSLGKTRFYHTFKEITGVSPSQFINRIRMQNAIHLLCYSEAAITDIAYDCGFETTSYFTRRFHQYTGASPRQFRSRIGRR